MIPDPELPIKEALDEADAHPDYIWEKLADVDWTMFDFERS
jgi:hypothetical protein